MKKLGFIAIFILLLSSANVVYGQDCLKGTICTGDRPEPCYDFQTENMCCATQNDCDIYKNASPEERKEFIIQNEVIQPKIEDLCKSAPENSDCRRCFEEGSAWTAIGCIETTPSGFIKKFLTTGIGIAGGIAFLLILFSGFQMLTSIGNPEKLNAGKELLTSAISGLVLIIFSIFILRLIGVDILGLPEFK